MGDAIDPRSRARRSVLITGGSSGIGRGAAASFAARGDRVAILARDGDRLRQAARALGPEVMALAADVRRRESIEAAIEQLVQAHGTIDVLVHAAGLLRPLAPGTPLAEAEAQWDQMLGTNLTGSFLVTWAALPHMRSPGGRVVFVSSVAAVTGGRSAGLAAYAASKAGLHGLAFSLARQLGPQGITVNCVALGLIEGTDLFPDGTAQRAPRVAALTPVGRAGRIEDAVSAIVHLTSPEASFITGEILHVNGGLVPGR